MQVVAAGQLTRLQRLNDAAFIEGGRTALGRSLGGWLQRLNDAAFIEGVQKALRRMDRQCCSA